jgi:hypothetical protein
MDATAEFAQLPLRLGDQLQWRYEVIRPLVLLADRTATQRAHETAPHPDTVRRLHRRFRQQGMRGLLPGDVEVRRRARPGPIPDDVREEMARLKALYGRGGALPRATYALRTSWARASCSRSACLAPPRGWPPCDPLSGRSARYRLTPPTG